MPHHLPHPALSFSLKSFFPFAAGALSALLGVTVLIAWHAQIDFLLRLRSDWPAMEYGAALAFALGGLGLVAANGGQSRLALLAGAATALLATRALGQHLLERAPDLAPALSLAFLLGGVGLIALAAEPAKPPGAARCVLGGLVGACLSLGGGLALLAHLINLRPLFDGEYVAAMSVHAAIGLCLLGGGLMVLAYRHSADEEGKILRGVAVGVVACQLALTLLLCGSLLHLEKQQRIEETRAETRSLGERLRTVLHERAKAIDRMAERWEIGGGTPHGLWRHDAGAYLNDMQGLQSIEWVDHQGRVRWVTPVAWQGKRAGLDLGQPGAHGRVLEQARNSRTALYSGVTRLADGQRAVLLARALRVEGRLDGYLVASFNAEVLFSRLTEDSTAQGYGLQVLRTGGTLFQHGETPTARLAAQMRSHRIGADHDNWEIRLWPSATMAPSRNPLLPWLVLAGGLALTAFTAILFLSWTRGIRAALQLRLAATVFENSREAISITDPLGNIISVNRAFTRITGYSAAEALGQNHRMLQSGRQDARFYEAMWAKVALQGHWAGEIWNRRKNGVVYPQAFSITQVKDAQGKVLHYIGMSYDITERKQREQALLAAKENAEQASQAKSHFLSSMSHELRTPLNAVIGFAQLLEMDEGLSREQKDNVGQILKGGNQLLKLVTEVLNLSRIKAGHLPLSMAPVACAGLVQDCLKTMAPLAQNRDIRLDSSGASQLTVLADRARLRQVLLNLLSNAIKFNHRGGSVRVNLVQVNANHARLEVRDTGCGVAADLKGRLFNPFERHETSPYLAGTDGTGIGLAVCKRLVEAMGGTISFSSTAGQGSTFWIEFPSVGQAVPEPNAMSAA